MMLFAAPDHDSEGSAIVVCADDARARTTKWVLVFAAPLSR
jgi:hypothetical protein